MELRRIYRNINPELLYDEVMDLVRKRGAVVVESKLQTYALPGGATHTVRGTLVFKVQDKQSGVEKECITVHIVGSAGGETKMMLDIDENLFAQSQISGLEEDLNFIFGPYELT